MGLAAGFAELVSPPSVLSQYSVATFYLKK